MRRRRRARSGLRIRDGMLPLRAFRLEPPERPLHRFNFKAEPCALLAADPEAIDAVFRLREAPGHGLDAAFDVHELLEPALRRGEGLHVIVPPCGAPDPEHDEADDGYRDRDQQEYLLAP